MIDGCRMTQYLRFLKDLVMEKRFIMCQASVPDIILNQVSLVCDVVTAIY